MSLRKAGLPALLAFATVVACGQARRNTFGEQADPTLPGEKGDFGGGEEVKGSDCKINNTANDPEKDYDGDGYALKDDCNECSTKINKGAYDLPGNGIDENCSGTADDEEIVCDDGLEMKASDPFDAAKAIGLCRRVDNGEIGWGVVSAKWVLPDGKVLKNLDGIGILPALGVNAAPTGSSMLVLSSGSARGPKDPGYKSTVDKKYGHGTPDGYPKESPACPGVTESGPAKDGVALEVTIRVPTNARSLIYQQNFFTWEYPDYICNSYNDFYVAMMTPIPSGLADGNIAFDQDTNPISVNNSLLQVCEPGTHGSAGLPAIPIPGFPGGGGSGGEKEFTCPLGKDGLKGTGFEGHAATGWLTTTAPVTPATEITMRFAIWDAGDGRYDSTVLIDDLRFSVEEAGVAQTAPTGVK